ncbi:MAG: CheY-like chemotaxis protein, partial [Myxococcota bacterium]
GSGLGLVTSARIAGLMGGKITVDRQSDKGLIFLFTAALPETDQEPAPAPASDVAVTSKALRPLQILVGEDRPVNAALIRHLLAGAGHSARIVGTGLKVIEALSNAPSDLVLMDLEMPEMGGLDATRQIRAREAKEGGHIPSIALTAHAVRGYRELCLDAGMDGYIAKPVDATDLLTTIERLVPSSLEKPLASVAHELTALYLQHVRKDVAALRELVSLGDAKAVMLVAYSLVGASGVVSAPAVVDIARATERRASKGDLSKVSEDGDSIELALADAGPS